jgi:hypothetical protein
MFELIFFYYLSYEFYFSVNRMRCPDTYLGAAPGWVVVRVDTTCFPFINQQETRYFRKKKLFTWEIIVKRNLTFIILRRLIFFKLLVVSGHIYSHPFNLRPELFWLHAHECCFFLFIQKDRVFDKLKESIIIFLCFCMNYYGFE